jgi:hypothetical protein
MSQTDRTEFEGRFPLANARDLPRASSDHTPIVSDSSEA